MRALRTIATTALRASATAASVSSSVLDRAAAVLRRAAGERSGDDIDVEHRSGFRVVEPARPAPPQPVTAPPEPVAAPPKPARAPSKAPAASSPTKAATTATAARSGARISNPKAARRVRKRDNGAAAERAASVTPIDASGDTHHGGSPVTVQAENTPSERARSKAGRQPAPMGARDKT